MMKQRPRMKHIPKGHDAYYNGKYSDESAEEIELSEKKAAIPQEFIEAQIQEGDTLQAIALRFNCSVSKLMRVNNILRENEIFAKKVLKIPITAYSLLTESIPSVHTSGNNSPTKLKVIDAKNNNSSIPIISDTEFQQKLIVASVNASELFIPNSSQESSLPSTSTSSSNTTSFSSNNSVELNEINQVTPLLLEKRDGARTGVEAVVINEFTTKGDDLGIKWIHLLIFILLLCVLIPFIYVLYIAEHPEKFHHHQDQP